MGTEALIGLFGAIVVVITIRRNTPRAIEIAAWLGLIVACVLTIAGTRSAQARLLTSAGIWGATQLATSLTGFLEQAISRWLFTSRFGIADWVVLAAGVNLFAIALIASRRAAEIQMPAVKLRDWFVMPARARRPALVRVFPVKEVRHRLNDLPATVTTTFATGGLHLLAPNGGGGAGETPSPVVEAPSARALVSSAMAQPKRAGRRKSIAPGSQKRKPKAGATTSRKRDEQGRLAS